MNSFKSSYLIVTILSIVNDVTVIGGQIRLEEWTILDLYHLECSIFISAAVQFDFVDGLIFLSV